MMAHMAVSEGTEAIAQIVAVVTLFCFGFWALGMQGLDGEVRNQ